MADQEMIDRVANEMWKASSWHIDFKSINEKHTLFPKKQEFMVNALAAIKAIREPTDKMVEAGLLNYLDCEKNKLPWNGRTLFKVMIGSILD